MPKGSDKRPRAAGPSQRAGLGKTPGRRREEHLWPWPQAFYPSGPREEEKSGACNRKVQTCNHHCAGVMGWHPSLHRAAFPRPQPLWLASVTPAVALEQGAECGAERALCSQPLSSPEPGPSLSEQPAHSPFAHDLGGVTSLFQQLGQEALRVWDAAHYLLRCVRWKGGAACEHRSFGRPCLAWPPGRAG